MANPAEYLNQLDLSQIMLGLSDEMTSIGKKLRQLLETRKRISFRLLWLAPFLASPLGAEWIFPGTRGWDDARVQRLEVVIALQKKQSYT